MRTLAGITPLLFACVTAGIGHAQAQVPGDLAQVCQTLAAGLKQDSLMQGSTRERFIVTQQVIAQDKYSNFQSASSSKLDLSISIPEYVDGVLGTKSDASSWSVNRDRFLKTDFAQLASSASAITTITRTSESAVQAVVSCAQVIANMNGFFGSLETVNTARNAFVVRMFRRTTDGDPDWQIRSFDANPPDPNFRCNEDIQNVTTSNPRAVTGLSIVINCTKSPDIQLLVTGNTSAGSVGPFIVRSIREDIKDIVERISNLEGALAATIPRQTLAYFEMQNCPPGWETVEPARGRYVVALQAGGAIGGAVGSALQNLENRAAGAHSHPVNGSVITGKGPGVQGGSDCCSMTVGAASTAGVQSSVGSGHVEGTNAPYVQYAFCRKH